MFPVKNNSSHLLITSCVSETVIKPFAWMNAFTLYNNRMKGSFYNLHFADEETEDQRD